MIPLFDKYAPYIWACYGITAVVLLGLLVLSINRSAQAKAELEALEAERKRAGDGA